MVGTLAHQAAIIWPKERKVLRRMLGNGLGRVLDVGCGTGEILRRLRAEFETDLVVGLDLYGGHLRLAEPPVVLADGFRAPFPDGAFDTVLVRHLLQALADPVALLREARRLSAGPVYLLVEDYLGLFFDAPDDDATTYTFAEVSPPFRPEGTDLLQGRRAFRHLREAGFSHIEVEPVLVDTLNSDREVFARVFEYWREGYARKLAQLIGVDESETRRRFDRMAELARDPDRYTAWLLFALLAK